MQTQTTVTASSDVQLNEKNKAPIFLHGRTHKQTTNFDNITYIELCDLAKTPIDLTQYSTNKAAKGNCPWFLPSDAPAKIKEIAIKHNNYTALVVDIDDGNKNLNEIINTLKELGHKRFLIYSTIKHQLTEEDKCYGNRWRVVIPLAYGITFDEWALMQKCLIKLFGGDDCANRAQQISYSPARYKGEYEFHSEGG